LNSLGNVCRDFDNDFGLAKCEGERFSVGTPRSPTPETVVAPMRTLGALVL
jgi:hypothetical protein